MNDKLTHKGYILKALLLFIVIVHSADVAMVKLCSQSRKQFKASEQDFYLAAAQRTFEQEKEFLKTELGIQPFIKTEKWNNDQQEYKPHNEQPSGMNKIYLLLVSFAVMILIYIITRKNKKKNG